MGIFLILLYGSIEMNTRAYAYMSIVERKDYDLDCNVHVEREVKKKSSFAFTGFTSTIKPSSRNFAKCAIRYDVYVQYLLANFEKPSHDCNFLKENSPPTLGPATNQNTFTLGLSHKV